MTYKRILQTSTTLLLLAFLTTGCGGSSSQGGDDKSSSTQLSTDGSTAIRDKANTSDQFANTTENDNTVSSKTGEFQTRAPAQDVTASDSALFIAEGDQGVEIVKIGYTDRVDYELITTITGINATKVFLSDDQMILYVQNKEGYINVYDIQNIKEPRKIKILTKDAIDTDAITTNGIYAFSPNGENGLNVYDVSNPANKELIAKYKGTPAYAIVLVDNDTKALVATKDEGVALLDITTPKDITYLATYPIKGEVTGLSVNIFSGLLFIANGDNGVQVFNLNLFLDNLY